MFCFHWIVTKIGFLFIESEVLRKGNEQLLDGFDEGVIVLEEKSNNILFYNAAAAGAHVESMPMLATEAMPELKAMV